MSEGKAGIGDLIRKVVSLILLVAAVIALVFFFVGAGATIGEPFRLAFEGGFNFSLFSQAIYDILIEISMPLIMVMLALIGLTVDH